MKTSFEPQIDLSVISAYAIEHQEENDQFSNYIKEFNDEAIDIKVQELDALISPTISCTDCGNCCKSLMVCLNEEEANNLSSHLKMDRSSFDHQYLEKGSNGMMIMNQMPCHFLKDNKCTVYEYRFEGCKEFPALHLPNFKRRIFTTFMHYDRCPIIFNVVEELKKAMNFKQKKSK
ncbi:YkgJ family cysteine cluster protein [Sediminibacterium sp.]|uniref:YkgJ family cysteine cluster protein n=1 Tax=Sediminibacterium sp. TaxID=1917865 RepID=UPI003F726938